jgi:hypothetical protein
MYRLAYRGEVISELEYETYAGARHYARVLAWCDESGEGVDILQGNVWVATVYRPLRAGAQ